MMMGSKQDKPDDKVAIADGLKLMRVFRRIASAEDLATFTKGLCKAGLPE